MTASSRGAWSAARLCLAVAACLSAAAALPRAQTASAAGALLRRTLGFSAADVRSLAAGSAVIHSLDTPVREELAHVAAVYVNTSPGAFLDRFRDIVAFEKGPGIPQIGRFGHPPRLEDLAGLTLPAPDLEALRACRPGDCDVKLSADAMERFRTGVDWSARDAPAEADAIARAMILDLVRAYQRDGNAALGSYEDGGTPMSVPVQFRAIMESETPLPVPVPALLAYLDDYPRNRPAGIEDFFYWTVVDFGLKPTVRVNHVLIYPLESSPASPVAYAIAIKQLYASHYFFTTLELRFLIEDGRDLALVSITRSRNDGMTGFKGLFLRPIIARRSREAVRVYLDHVKHQIEHPSPAAY